MKSIITFSVVLLSSSFVLAAGPKVLATCTTYEPAEDCVYDAYDARDWSCDQDYPRVPTKAKYSMEAYPYQKVLTLKVTLDSKNVVVAEKTTTDALTSQSTSAVLTQIKGVTCIGGSVDCETSTRAIGLYLLRFENTMDQIESFELIERIGNQRKTLATFDSCK